MDEDSSNSSGSIQNPVKFQRFPTGRARAKIKKKKWFKKNMFPGKYMFFSGQDMP